MYNYQHQIFIAVIQYFFGRSCVSNFLCTEQLTTALASREQKEYVAAGGVAEEVLSSIRTVVAFGGEKSECER